ncbi:MAG: hypothetical protein OHK0019_19370 [Saprospiraceae bacterium]
MSLRPLFPLLLFVFLACGNESEKIQTAAITGRWELSRGFRNQKETETLQGVFFQFGTDGKMTTNLPVGADSPTDFELKKNEIHQKSPQPVVYKIQSVTDSTLVLAMEMRGVQFEMHLIKALPSTETLPQDSLVQPSDSFSR